MWKERVKDELMQLQDKLSKLEAALQQHEKFNISEVQLQLMQQQYAAMSEYCAILEKRLQVD